jgi:thymidylate kinase
MIIAIEGGDACGKATQTKLLAERLGGVRLAFPDYEQPCGKAILGHLKRQWKVCTMFDMIHAAGMPRYQQPTATEQYEMDDHLNALVFQCLQTVNRLEMLPVIHAVLSSERHLVFDRYTASGVVYGMLDGVDPTWVELVNASLPQPDLWVLLDVPVEEGFRRRPERRDRYEVDRAYLEKVRTGYLRLFEEKTRRRDELHQGVEQIANLLDKHVGGAPLKRRKPSWAHWHVVDGLGTVEEVQARIWNVVEPLVKQRGGGLNRPTP